MWLQFSRFWGANDTWISWHHQAYYDNFHCLLKWRYLFNFLFLARFEGQWAKALLALQAGPVSQLTGTTGLAVCPSPPIWYKINKFLDMCKKNILEWVFFLESKVRVLTIYIYIYIYTHILRNDSLYIHS